MPVQHSQRVELPDPVTHILIDLPSAAVRAFSRRDEREEFAPCENVIRGGCELAAIQRSVRFSRT
jgi:hypothetical protein